MRRNLLANQNGLVGNSASLRLRHCCCACFVHAASMTLHVMRLFSMRTKLHAQPAASRALSSARRGNRFDITHRSHIVRSSSPRSTRQDRNSMAAWKLSGAFTRFDRSFEVFEVSKAGELKRTSVTLANVLRDFGVHARDMLSLGLQDERYNPPPAVLPRQGVVVIALGPFKALVHTEGCLLFEACKIDVSHMAPMLAELMQANNEVPPSECRVDVSGAAESGQPYIPPPPPSGRPSAGAKNIDGVRTAGHDENASTLAASLTPEGRSGPSSRSSKAKDAAATASAAAVGDTAKSLLDTAPAEAAAAAAGVAAAKASAAAAAIAGGGDSPEIESSQQPPAIREGTRVDSQQQTTTTTGDEDQSTADKLAEKLGEYVEGALRFGAGTGALDGEEGAEKEEEETQEHQMKVMFREQLPMPFELAMLEAMLQEVCTTFHRRAHVVRRLMEQGLKPSETTTFFAPSRIEHYRVVPLKLALNQLELKLSQTRACLEELMKSDEDMLGLLLTEAKDLGEGEMLDPHRHSVVELLLESYHRQLVLVGHDVAAMKQEMESLQELSAISLDVSLNSMIAVDVRLAMLNLGVATSACIFGALGMNTVNGLENSNIAFYAILGGSAVASVVALGGVMRHLRTLVRAGDSQQGKLMALNTICDHVDDIESVLRIELEAIQTASDGGGAECGGVIRRKAMAKKLSQARGKEVSDEELDLIFEVFDTSGDGAIDTREYGKLVSEPAGSLGSNAGGVGEGAGATSEILASREKRPTI